MTEELPGYVAIKLELCMLLLLLSFSGYYSSCSTKPPVLSSPFSKSQLFHVSAYKQLPEAALAGSVST